MSSGNARASLYRNRDYLLLWSGQTVSAIGSQFSGFVIPLLVLAITGSPAQAGFVVAAMGLPYIIFSLPAGALVDRWNRKAVMVVCDSGRALNMLSVPIALGIGHLSIGQLYAVALIEGTLFVFFNVAETASLPAVVSAEQLPAALAQQEMTWGISALTGPALAGLLYTAASAAVPFVVDAVSYVASALSLTSIRVAFQGSPSAPQENLLTGMRGALAWLWRQPLIRALALLTAAGDFLASGIGLIPIVIARQQMHAPAAAIGLIFTLAAIGGIAGSLASSQVQRRLGFGPAVIGTSWAFALLYPLLLAAPNTLGLGAVRLLLSATVSISNPIRLSYQMAVTPDRLRGRINSLSTLLSYGSLPIGQALTGILLEHAGITRTVLAITAGFIVTALGATLSRNIRNASPFEELGPGEPT